MGKEVVKEVEGPAVEPDSKAEAKRDISGGEVVIVWLRGGLKSKNQRCDHRGPLRQENRLSPS